MELHAFFLFVAPGTAVCQSVLEKQGVVSTPFMYKHVSARNLSKGTFLKVMFASAVFISAFWINANYYEITKELKNGTASNFAQSYDERLGLMEQSDNETLYVDPLPDSKALRFDDLTKDVTDWRNTAWSGYYGVEMALKE